MPVGPAGSNTTVDGITARPAYAFEPPAAFFALPAAGPPTGANVYNVLDYGARADAAFNNTPAIQAAIDAAHDAGGGIVYVPPGTYGIRGTGTPSDGGVQLKDNVFLKGAGLGETTLRIVDNTNVAVTGIVRSPSNEITKNFGLADIALDGNRANNGTAKTDGFFCGVQPEDPRADEDVYVLRVEAKNNYGYGFDPHEQTHRLIIEGCVAHGNGLDGFTEDFQVDGVFRNNVAYNNDRHGFNIVTTTNDCLFENNVAYGNGGSGITIQRGTPPIDSPFNLVVRGGAVYGNGKEGINIQMSSDILVTGVDVYDNGRAGIRIYGSSHVTLDGNTLRDNGQSNPLGYSAIQIVEDPDETNGLLYRADYNLIRNNVITNTGSVDTRYGIEERVGGQGGNPVGNIVVDNAVTGTERGPANLLDAVMELRGDDAANLQIGSRTKDRLAGNGGNDTQTGDAGNDTIEGGAGDDRLDGGSGDDLLRGGDGHDSVVGGSGNDRLGSGFGRDTVAGGDGDDHLWLAGDLLGDAYQGGDGSDTLGLGYLRQGVRVDLTAGRVTGAGGDTISGFERVLGSHFADTLIGSAGADTLVGRGGMDWINGRAGADTLSGGLGRDTFIFDNKSSVVVGGVHQGIDHITDFSVGDRLDLRGLVAAQTAATIGQVVRLTDGAAGTSVAVKIDGTFQTIAVLDGVHGLTVTGLWGNDQILA